jgi:hypothetical protein
MCLLLLLCLLQGYVALGFPAVPGKMFPSDAVIGSIDAAAGTMMVRGEWGWPS